MTSSELADLAWLAPDARWHGMKRSGGGRDACLRIARRWLPILTWLPRYSWHDAAGDAVAGLTVGLMIVPQALAYAGVARLPFQYGLYSSFIGPLVYVVLGTSRDLSVGPTAVMAALVASAAAGDVGDAAVLALIAGLMQLLLGIAHIGMLLVDFLAYPVIAGFTSAVAVSIMAQQLHTLLGERVSVRSDIIGALIDTGAGLGQAVRTAWPDILLGIACLAAVVLIGRWGAAPKTNEKESKWVRIAQLWRQRLVMARSGLVVAIAGLLSFIISAAGGGEPFHLLGDVPAGLPRPSAPDLLARGRSLFLSGVLIALVGLLECVAIVQAMAQRGGYAVDCNQELRSLGLTNIVGSCLGAFPVTGSFSRSAVNSQAGVRTQLANGYVALTVLLALAVLTPAFYYIPVASLAAIIIGALAPMADWRVAVRLAALSTSDLLLWTLAFVGCITLGVEIGMVIAVIASIVCLLYRAARPVIIVTTMSSLADWVSMPVPLVLSPTMAGESDAPITVVRIVGPVVFCSASYVREAIEGCWKVQQTAAGRTIPLNADGHERDEFGDEKLARGRVVVVDLSGVAMMDVTGARAIADAANQLASRAVSTRLVLSPVPRVNRLLDRISLLHGKGDSHAPSGTPPLSAQPTERTSLLH